MLVYEVVWVGFRRDVDFRMYNGVDVCVDSSLVVRLCVGYW